jgi:hypothetical protein
MEPMHGRTPIILVSLFHSAIFLPSIDPMPQAYTASTAGEQGFLQLLPIYVDHILYPTMTKAAFLTEVGSFSKLLFLDTLTHA